MDMETDHRDQMSETYAKAVTAPAAEAAEAEGATPKSVVARYAGYTEEERKSVPEDAVVNAFGCGNPVAFAEVAEGEVWAAFGFIAAEAALAIEVGLTPSAGSPGQEAGRAF